MPIDTLHPDYIEVQGQWERCRDAAGGEDLVKKKAETYLPMLGGHAEKPHLYEAYKKRGLFLEAMPRTIQGLAGAVFRKQPTISIPRSFRAEEWLMDVTGSGQPLERFAQHVLKEDLEITRVGIWLTMDASPSSENVPRLALVPGENITNWDDENGRWLVLKEQAPKVTEDRFERKFVDQWRLFELDETDQLVVSFWQKSDSVQEDGKQGIVQVGEDLTPMRMGKRLDFIPIEVVAGDVLDWTPVKPALLGLADASFDHYRLITDYRHGLHWTALPTPTASGLNTKEEVSIGSGTLLKGPLGATFGMLEFTGQGLKPLQEAIREVTDYMASLGARLLEQPKRAAEAAETVALRARAEQTTVQSMAWAVSQALTKQVRRALWWGNMQDDAFEITLNTDLVDASVDTERLKALSAMVMAGQMSHETLYFNLKRAELTRPGIEAEDELRQIGEVEDDTFSEAAG